MQFTVPHDHPSLPGHFPGRPLVPGVVVLERVVDAIEAAHGALGPLRLPQVKFLQPLQPGEPARVELERVAAVAVALPASARPALEQPAAGLSAPAQRWRFRVVRLRDEMLLASGEVVAQAPR